MKRIITTLALIGTLISPLAAFAEPVDEEIFQFEVTIPSADKTFSIPLTGYLNGRSSSKELYDKHRIVLVHIGHWPIFGNGRCKV